MPSTSTSTSTAIIAAAQALPETVEPVPAVVAEDPTPAPLKHQQVESEHVPIVMDDEDTPALGAPADETDKPKKKTGFFGKKR